MQKKKNLKLLAVLLVLLIWTIIFINLEQSSYKIALDEKQFSIEDTASITNIIIRKPSETIQLDRKENHWTINKKYKVDPSMRKVLLAVLHEVRVKRTVPQKNKPEILKSLENEGIYVTISQSDESAHEFVAGGNKISLSYFTSDFENIYVVNLPGYESYVSGIFEVSENDWRDRLLYQSSLLGINNFKVLYSNPSLKSIDIAPSDDFYSVTGVSNLDTVKLMSYVENYSFFYTDQYISKGQVSAYDSLAKTKPFASLVVNALGLKNPYNIDFYNPIPGENVTLGIINKNQFALFQTERIAGLFVDRRYFENKSK